MIKVICILFALIIQSLHAFSQVQEKIIYIIDSILVVNDPEEGDELAETDIEYLNVIRNKDSLSKLGFEKFDGVIFIFTKEYSKRPGTIKQIPSTKQMERKNGIWYYKGNASNGKFIDYYYSGRKQGEGTFLDGKIDGLRVLFHQNGEMISERKYSNGIPNGLAKEFYDDGTLKQEGEFVNGKEEGVWEMYYPNSMLKQRSNFKGGSIDGESTAYYSSGRILAAEVIKNGKTIPDKQLQKVNQAMSKGHVNSKEGDYKGAAKNYLKAIEIDSSNAQAYFALGTAKLNDFKFDEAILDFDQALKYEPYLEKALTNRAFARIRKYQFESSRKLSESNGVTILASKDNPGIPPGEIKMICDDLRQAMFLGEKGTMILDAVKEFCERED